MMTLKINMTIIQDYYLQKLLVMSIMILAEIETCLILLIIRLSQNTLIANKLIIGKMKDETWGVAIEEFVVLKPNVYSVLSDNSEHEKAKGVNKNVVSTISYNEYEDV